ncbi:hypothetical protein AB0K48_29075, partial [Nonomuraea sp. NPDC055795]
MKVLVYSDDAGTRDKVRQAIGRRPAADVPFVEIVECATEPKVHQWLGSGEIDVAVLPPAVRHHEHHVRPLPRLDRLPGDPQRRVQG